VRGRKSRNKYRKTDGNWIYVLFIIVTESECQRIIHRIGSGRGVALQNQMPCCFAVLKMEVNPMSHRLCVAKRAFFPLLHSFENSLVTLSPSS